jgi:hypothetical protein
MPDRIRKRRAICTDIDPNHFISKWTQPRQREEPILNHDNNPPSSVVHPQFRQRRHKQHKIAKAIGPNDKESSVGI